MLITTVALLASASPICAQTVEVPTFEVAHMDGTFTMVATAGGWGGLHFLTTNGSYPTPVFWRFNAQGTTRRSVGNFSGGSLLAPGLAADPYGGYVAGWMIYNAGGSNFVTLQHLGNDGAPDPIATANSGAFVSGAPAVAGLPSGSVIVWSDSNTTRIALLGRRYDLSGQPLGDAFDIGFSSSPVDVAATSDGGFIVGWMEGTTPQPAKARAYDATGQPRTDEFVVSDFQFYHIAASPVGDVAAAVGTRVNASDASMTDIVAHRFTGDGTSLGPDILVGSVASRFFYGRPDVAIGFGGQLFVVWSDFDGILARGFDSAGVALGPAQRVSNRSALVALSTAVLPSGSFVSAWSGGTAYANVVTLCPAGTAVCGDGVVDGLCERCDDGVANSDTTADACRSNCLPAHCGDGTLDTGEECDDANYDACDGCAPNCTLETGVVCGDGLQNRTCGEQCDDGNAQVGDGCTPQCTLELIPGGGTATSDCFTEWVVDNPTNVPFTDRHGAVNGVQRCVDDDPACDFDGGAAGSCTFHLRVCGLDTDIQGCVPPRRLAAWTLTRPSAKQAAGAPALAQVRAALAAVPGAIVGPDEPNVCSSFLSVAVPLRGAPGAFHRGKLILKSVATDYSGKEDGDKLKLYCDPSP